MKDKTVPSQCSVNNETNYSDQSNEIKMAQSRKWQKTKKKNKQTSENERTNKQTNNRTILRFQKRLCGNFVVDYKEKIFP